MTWIIGGFFLYMYMWGAILMYDIYGPTNAERWGLALWPFLPLVWFPQFVWWKWGRRMFKRIKRILP